MNIQTILFMSNDFARAKFTLENFNKWNPDIPIRVINSGGKSPEPYLQHIPNIEFVDAPNLWHRADDGKGSFGPKFAEYFFEYGVNNKYSHTLLLETDVLTNRTISIEPKYDISGITNFGGSDLIYNYLEVAGHRLHSGCGGTIFSHKYFNNILSQNNFQLFNQLFDKFQIHYYMDFILTIIGRKSGCSYGNWEEVSETKRYVSYDPNKSETLKVGYPNLSATMVHDFKIDLYKDWISLYNRDETSKQLVKNYPRENL